MIKFNPICVDNFFDNPDEIRKFGLGLKKEPHYKGSWPGERSDELFKIDEDFNSKNLKEEKKIWNISLNKWEDLDNKFNPEFIFGLKSDGTANVEVEDGSLSINS